MNITRSILLIVLALGFGLLLALVARERHSAGLSPAAAMVEMPPPVARRAPQVLREHGRERIDDYPWLRERSHPDSMAYLRAENDYATSRLARLTPLIEEIAGELQRRMDGAGDNVDFVDAAHVYSQRMTQGAQFPVIVRQPPGGGTEQVVLDIERLARGHEHYSLDNYVVSPDGNTVAFAVDFTGDLRHRIFIRDIPGDALHDTGISGASGGMVLAENSGALYLLYIRLQEPSLRGHQLWRHRVGTPAAQDELVYEETDNTFELRLRKSKSGRYIFLNSVQQQSTEVRILAADNPRAPPILMQPRQRGHVYEPDHAAGRFFIRTNDRASDFRIVTAPETSPGAAHWEDFVPESPGRVISRMEAFDRFVVLTEEHDALQSLRIVRLADRREMPVPRPADIGAMDLSFWQSVTNRDPAARVLRIRFSGPLHPLSLYDFDTESGALTLRWQSPATRWFDASHYEVRRIRGIAPDGEEVPVTLIYRRDKFRPGGNPALIVGYGAYGFSMQPRFHAPWISLVDRGFVYALAHVRGGKEKGRRWHDQGRMLNKRNTFTDFAAVTEALAAQGYADPRRMFARGGSAGGLLMGVLANTRAELYAGLVAEVPFVDVISTTSDPSLPTASLEYDEWGNPAVREQYDYMLSYSPYDNVGARAYPPMLVTTARHDSQVGFHEPAKWVARLRARKTDSNEILLLSNMAAGHSGTPGRFGAVAENAQIMAWLLARAEQ